MWQACNELREELGWGRRVDDEDCQLPDGRRGLCEHFECAVAMLRKQGERDALNRPLAMTRGAPSIPL